MPSGWAVNMTFGTFNQLGITDATEFPGLLARLVSSEVSAPAAESVQWGNASGYQVLVADAQRRADDARRAAGDRRAGAWPLCAGFAPSAVWDGGAGAQFDALAQTLHFALPQRDENYIDTIVHNDGGVLWQFLSATALQRARRDGRRHHV